VLHAKPEVLQTYDSISVEHSVKQHNASKILDVRLSSPKHSMPIASPKTRFPFSQEFEAQNSYPLDPNATVFQPKLHCVAENKESALKDVIQYLRKHLPEIRKFGGNPLKYVRFIR
jgi:hypothetical protein